MPTEGFLLQFVPKVPGDDGVPDPAVKLISKLSAKGNIVTGLVHPGGGGDDLITNFLHKFEPGRKASLLMIELSTAFMR